MIFEEVLHSFIQELFTQGHELRNLEEVLWLIRTIHLYFILFIFGRKGVVQIIITNVSAHYGTSQKAIVFHNAMFIK